MMKEKKRQHLFSLMKVGNEKRFFKEINNWKKKSNDFPHELEIGDKVYKGKEVLSGFAESAYKQSRDSRKEKWIPSETHHSKKQVIRIEEIKARKSKMKLKSMSKEVFNRMLKKIPKEKAPDIFFNTVEHYVNADDEVKEALRTICNEMILDDKKYSSPLLSMSTSTYLYKQY